VDSYYEGASLTILGDLDFMTDKVSQAFVTLP
jgi:hypothetical protein